MPIQLIAPDVLAEARGLSIPWCAGGIVLGLSLWASGWRFHRFWMALSATIFAGIYGLSLLTDFGPRMLAVAILLAVAIGLLSQELSRCVAFVVSGFTILLATRSMIPDVPEPLIPFLIGGLVGILLFRLEMMLFTSFCGVLLWAYSAGLLYEKVGKTSLDNWVKSNVMALNFGVGAACLLGVVIQGKWESWRNNKGSRRKQRAYSVLSEDERKALDSLPPRKPSIWDRIRSYLPRAA
jgi:hypothetical protein